MVTDEKSQTREEAEDELGHANVWQALLHEDPVPPPLPKRIVRQTARATLSLLQILDKIGAKMINAFKDLLGWIWRQRNEFLYYCVQWVLFLAAIAFTGWLGWVVYKNTTSSGQIEFCYIDYSKSTKDYQLNAFKEWRVDDNLGNYSDIEKAKAAADAINCPLGKKP